MLRMITCKRINTRTEIVQDECPSSSCMDFRAAGKIFYPTHVVSDERRRRQATIDRARDDRVKQQLQGCE